MDHRTNHIPKIQTESKYDILYLKENISSFALNKTSSSTVINLFHKWLQKTFEHASGNISVNGLEYKEAFELLKNVEPLDEELHNEVAQLQTKAEHLMLRISDFRKDAPPILATLLNKVVEMESMPSHLTNFTYEDYPVEPLTELTQQMEKFVEQYDSIIMKLMSLQERLPELAEKYERGECLLEELLNTENKAKISHSSCKILDKEDSPMVDDKLRIKELKWAFIKEFQQRV